MQIVRQGHLAAEAACPPEGLFYERGSQALIRLCCNVDKGHARPAREAAVVVAAAKVAPYLGLDPPRCADLRLLMIVLCRV